jgi:hypothetical protein
MSTPREALDGRLPIHPEGRKGDTTTTTIDLSGLIWQQARASSQATELAERINEIRPGTYSTRTERDATDWAIAMNELIKIETHLAKISAFLDKLRIPTWLLR